MQNCITSLLEGIHAREESRLRVQEGGSVPCGRGDGGGTGRSGVESAPAELESTVEELGRLLGHTRSAQGATGGARRAAARCGGAGWGQVSLRSCTTRSGRSRGGR
jgi:hypothetical protein